MTDPSSRPAVAGGVPVRREPLPYGRHEVTGDDRAAVLDVLERGPLTGGPWVADFEAALAATAGAADAVAVSNGTAALHLALAVLDTGPGDEVITTPLTFVASANAVRFTGATPVFADIGADRCLDPASVAARCTPRTRAVVVVDYGGLPADLPALRAALPPDLPLVVDAAHSLGGTLHGAPVGAEGTVVTTSFHPVKAITTGEGGACIVGDPALADRLRHLRNHAMTSTWGDRSGAHWRYDVTELGWNYRLSDLQAALGHSQLSRLADLVARRRALADRYDRALAGVEGLELPPRPPGRSSAWHLYVVAAGPAFGWTGDELIDALRMEGIGATRHYPCVHLLAAYRAEGHAPGEAPRAEALVPQLVTLPLFPTMTGQDQDDVIAAVTRLAEWRR